MSCAGLSWHSQAPSGRIIRPPAVLHAGQWGPFVRDPSGIWVLPEGERAVTPLSGVALGAPPAGEPQRQDWANGFSQSLAALTPYKDYISQKSDALGVGIGTLETIWTEMTATDPGALPAIEVAMKLADVVIGLANQLVGVGATVSDLAAKAASQVTDAVGSAAGVVPLLGAIIDIIISFFDTEDEDRQALKEAERQALQMVKQQCSAWTALNKPVGTGPAGTSSPTPADIFSRIAEQGPGQKLPYNIGSIYVLLCGPEAEGYAGDEAWYSATKLNRVNWIPRPQRRLMWEVIKGIMAARAPRGFHSGVDNPLTTDFGKALMPYLQELVRRYGPKQGGGRGWWDHWFVRRASFVLGGVECATASVGGQKAEVCRRCDNSLREWWSEPEELGFVKYDSSVGVQWTNSIISWQNKLAYEINPKWKEHAAEMNRVAGERMKAYFTEQGATKLLANAALSEGVFAQYQQSEREKAERRRAVLRGVAGVAGSAAAGYLAWTGMRKFGPRRGAR
jgi:hypothetical protein